MRTLPRNAVWTRAKPLLWGLLAIPPVFAGSVSAPGWVPDGLLNPPAEEPWLCQGRYLTPEQGKAILDAFLAEHDSLDAWKAFAAKARKHILEGSGLSPLPEKTPLTPVLSEPREYDGYTVQNIRFQSIPGYWVTGNLYLPVNGGAVHAAVLHTHGHSSGVDDPGGWIRHGRFKEDVQKRAAALARMGAVSLTIDMVGYGDSTLVLEGDVHHTPLALTLQLWNTIRAVDYLAQRDDVDASRIGVTGHSGGGTQAFLLSALDPRVRAVVPVAMVSSWFFGGCECESGQPIHAGDGFFMNNAMIAALTAPRPLKLVSNGGDWTVHAPEIEFPFLQEIYRLHDKEENVAHTYLADEGHNYGINKRHAMYPFMAWHLGLDMGAIMDRDGEITEANLFVEDPARMRNFTGPEDIPHNALRTHCEILSRWQALQDPGLSLMLPYDLTVDALENPVGVDSREPAFSWKLQSPERGARQAAFQIQVAGSPGGFAEISGLEWDSGRLESSQQLHVPYAGQPLGSSRTYWWRVRVWDARGNPSAWTASRSFVTGILDGEGWEAEWIAHPGWLEFSRPHLGYRSEPSPTVDTRKWIQIDLGGVHPVDTVVLHALRHTVAERLGFPMEFRVELSAGPAFDNPVVIADYTGDPWHNSWTTKHEIDAGGVPARFVKVTATRLRELNGEICLAFNQIEVLSKGKNIAEGAGVSASDSLEEGLWAASAVVDGKGLPKANPVGNRTVLLRREFRLEEKPEQAVVHVSGLGQYVLYVNGDRVGAEKLSPGWTDSGKTVLYDTFDLSDALHAGSNTIGIALANGMYTVPDPDGRYTKFIGRFRELKALLQAEIRFKDGKSTTISTGDGWQTRMGPWTYSHVYGGEDFDARILDDSWKSAGFDVSDWTKARIAEPPAGVLRGESQAHPPIRVIEELEPVEVNPLDDDTTVYDLGQNTSLMLRLNVSGPRGSKVRVYPAELLREDGTANQSSAAPGRGVAYWEYALAGKGEAETWESEFFYHGGRYLQVERIPAEDGATLPEINRITGLVTHSSAARAGYLKTSSDLWNRTAGLIRWAQRSNMASVLTDCPHRERLGWLEQYHLNGPSLRYHYNLETLFRKTFQDMADAQTGDGLVPDIAPEYIVFPGPFRDSPEWGSAVILAAWQQYLFTGDTDVLKIHYTSMERYFNYLQSKAEDHLLDHGLGDWYDLGPGNHGLSQLTPVGLTASATFYENALRLADISRLLGKPEKADSYLEEASRIRDAFNRKYFDPENKTYATGSQTANAMPYVLGMVPEGDEPDVLNAIIKDIEEHNNGFTSGDVGHAYLLRALSMGERPDVVFSMHHQTERPGYGYQLAQGATSLTEAWDASPNNSQNHFMLGHIIEWFYGTLAGIQPTPGNPGFSLFEIRPQPAGDISHVDAHYASVRGPVRVRWENDGNGFHLRLHVPANTQARVHLPAGANDRILAGGKPVSANPFIEPVRADDGRAVFLLQSGDYQFDVNKVP